MKEKMKILGKIQWHGKERALLVKEQEEIFGYYTLEWICSYMPGSKNRKVSFDEKIVTKQNILQILNLSKNIDENYYIQTIGKIEIENEYKEILLKKEESSVEYYYLNLIGVYTPKMPGQTIIFREDTLENKVSAEIKDNEQRNKMLPLEQEQIKQFLEKIKIRNVLEDIELNKTKKETQVILPKHQEERKNKLGNINIKQEINMNTRVTDMKNLEQVLDKSDKMPELKKGDKPLKVGIVESDDLKKLRNEKGQKEQGHFSRYETVLITKKGEIKAIDLENDTQEGTNPTEKNYQVKQDKSVQKNDVLTRLKVGEGTIGIEKGQYGEVEIYHSPRKTIGGKNIEGNKSLDRQLETSESKNALEGTDIESLKLAQEYNDGYRSVEDGYQEVEEHKKQNDKCEPKSAKDLDGDPNTKSHQHETEEYIELSSGEKVSYNKLASRWGFYKDGKPDGQFVKEEMEKKKETDKKPEDIIEELDEEYEDPRAPQRGR